MADLGNLNADSIKRWSPLLKYQPGAVERLGQLIKAESSWVKENCLPVTPAFVQDVFLAKYVGRAADVDELLSLETKSDNLSQLENNLTSESTDISIPPPPQRSRLRRQSSFELQVEQDKQARQKVRTVLTGDDGQTGLRARIFRKGQGLISRWQLRHLVSLYSTAEAALDKACFFVRTQDRQKLLSDLDEDDSPVVVIQSFFLLFFLRDMIEGFCMFYTCALSRISYRVPPANNTNVHYT